MKVYLDTIGCRLNQSEIESYARQFRAAGHVLVPTAEQADLVVINTCTVTAQAESDSRQKVRQAGRAGCESIIVTGCWATLNPQSAAALPAVSRVVQNATKDTLVADLLALPAEAFDLEPLAREALPGERGRTRAFIKVQDGCDNHCTYCITTIARGDSRSRPLKEVLAEVRAAQRGGVQEVVLSGVHLGSWGYDFAAPDRLTALVRAILEQTEIHRLRLSSLEPWDLDQEFFTLWENSRLCRHLHVPLQSGSASILRRMARKTTPESYAALLAAARAAVPDIAITTDVIVGFPGEGEVEFNETLSMVRAMQFAGGHVFTYSERAGTAAARLPGAVPYPTRKIRNAQLRAAFAEAANAYRQRYCGQTLPVLWESAEPLSEAGWELRGLTDNYLRVTTHATENLWNQVSRVKLEVCTQDGLVGTIINP